MPDLFLAEDVQALLLKKKVAFMGCSNIRAQYKDLVTLYQGDHIISGKALKTKMEESFLSDSLVCHGKKHNGRDYREERVFQTEDVSISFYFLTRVYSDYVEGILRRMVLDPPDIVVVSSCLWDICRWGPNGVVEYKENLRLLFRELTNRLPSRTLLIWLTTAPIAQAVNGGFLISQLEFLQYSLRFHVLEANAFCAEMADRYRVDVLDIHYHLRMLLDLRAEDGVHWTPLAIRLSTNLLLTHIAISLGLPMPKRTEDCYTTVEKEGLSENSTPATGQLQIAALDSTLPNDLSYGQIFGQDQRVVQEMKRNAAELAATPRRARRRCAQYRPPRAHHRSYSQGRYGSYRYQK
ncbi:PC-esterase domain-containing protein 1A-like [Ornithodoros turicata]|uniref:PC-esterase domain-containing protein 1A-like n=1 Tax=Ornithodoros turicata TaxID=34597 RepID=UPI00313A3756